MHSDTHLGGHHKNSVSANTRVHTSLGLSNSFEHRVLRGHGRGVQALEMKGEELGVEGGRKGAVMEQLVRARATIAG
eukprot:953491-Rhodomonas_salina.2